MWDSIPRPCNVFFSRPYHQCDQILENTTILSKNKKYLAIIEGFFSVWPWRSLIEGVEGCIGPSGKLLCFWTNRKKNLQHMPSNISSMFECWTAPVVHFLLLKNSIVWYNFLSFHGSFWANVHCCKWPNLEQMIKPSCHTSYHRTVTRVTIHKYRHTITKCKIVKVKIKRPWNNF